MGEEIEVCGVGRRFFTAVVAGALVIATGIGYAPPAHAATVTNAVTVPAMAADWVEPITIPTFNTALGTLNSISITIGADVSGVIQLENTLSAPSTYDATLFADVTVSVAGTASTAGQAVQGASGTTSGFDGTLDFDGRSGATINLSGTTNLVVPSPQPGPNAAWCSFLDNGITLVPDLEVAVIRGFSVTGPGTFTTMHEASVGAIVSVTYDFLPGTPDPTPCPTTPGTGELTVQKQVLGSGTPAGDFAFRVDTQTPTCQEPTPNTFTITGAGMGSLTVQDVDTTGATCLYNIVETNSAGCIDTVGPAGIAASANETIPWSNVCIGTNSIGVNKSVTAGVASGPFEYTVTPSTTSSCATPSPNTFTLTGPGAASIQVPDVAATGETCSYDITETDTGGCVDDTGSRTGLVGDNVVDWSNTCPTPAPPIPAAVILTPEPIPEPIATEPPADEVASVTVARVPAPAPPSAGLAVTGFESERLSQVAFALLAMGLTSCAAARHRRQHR